MSSNPLLSTNGPYSNFPVCAKFTSEKTIHSKPNCGERISNLRPSTPKAILWGMNSQGHANLGNIDFDNWSNLHRDIILKFINASQDNDSSHDRKRRATEKHSKTLSKGKRELMKDRRLRAIALVIVNLLVLIGLRYWIINSEIFVPLLNGLPS